ncbi:small Nuclear ribonucleoprotein splicing factor [Moesziomyces antarcticus T-34]|uniref:UV excision repair protein RAD23 n=1 Tax=Pseudozyma antarctica (strain T-34) TaxID=1151754 RepID=M9LJ81_PSEA3|nr:small Nuclear ribonucleoprotein splicing factor [Moesziomyces antarcticus T-34]
MKLLIKSLAGGNFHLDAELSDTIGAIKQKIQAEQGHKPEWQKIIFSGKILTDDKTVADCNIKEKDFLVVMQLVQQNPAALQPLVQAIAQSNPQLAEAMNHDPQGVLSLLAGGAGGAGEEMELPTLAELSDEDRAGVEQIVAMGIPEDKAIESFFMCGKNVEMAVQYYFENPQDFDD